jgi:phosphatidylglycerophosphatase A
VTVPNLGRPQDRAPRPPAALILSTPEHMVAFGFGAGLSPYAPGTVGTLLAVPLWVLVCWLPWPAYLMLVAALFGVGVLICGRSARLLGVPDHSGIVFDEVVGFLVAAASILPGQSTAAGPLWLWLVAAFALFRFFDIVKPWPIRQLDRSVHGGLGIMLDDFVAGVYAGILLGIARWIM